MTDSTTANYDNSERSVGEGRSWAV